MILLFAPYAYDDSCVIDGTEPLHIESFSTWCAIKAFVVTVLPGATG